MVAHPFIGKHGRVIIYDWSRAISHAPQMFLTVRNNEVVERSQIVYSVQRRERQGGEAIYDYIHRAHYLI
jgi:hypothetical protein